MSISIAAPRLTCEGERGVDPIMPLEKENTQSPTRIIYRQIAKKLCQGRMDICCLAGFGSIL
jgi:hypothetical protein